MKRTSKGESKEFTPLNESTLKKGLQARVKESDVEVRQEGEEER